MKNIWNTYKLPLLILINILPFALNVLFYRTGAVDDYLLHVPILIGLSILNYKNSSKVSQLLLLHMLILICTVSAGFASSYLYYHNVSNDSMTPIIFQLMLIIEVTVSIISMTVTVILKAILNQRKAST